MVDNVRLTGDATPLVNALNRGTEAWQRFNSAQITAVSQSAKVTKSGTQLIGTLTAVDKQGQKITGTFKDVGNGFQLMETSVKKASSAFQQGQKSAAGFETSLTSIRRAVGFALLFRSITALQNALTEGTEAAIEFSTSIAEIQTIQGRSALTTQQWTSNLRNLSDSFGLDILNQAEAAYQTLSNQVAKGRDTFVFLETANRLALTAVTDTASSVNLLTSAVNAFQLDASQAERAAAQFFRTVELGRVRVEELSDIFGRIGVPANQLGISLQEVNAAIAAVTIQGVKSEEAITLVRNVILKLIKPTDDLKRIFDELGVSSAEAGIAAFGFGEFLARIEKAAGGTTTGIAKAFGRVRAITGALVLGRQGLEAYNETLQAQNDPNLLKDFERNFQTVFTSNGEVVKREANRIKNFFQVELGQNVLTAAANFTRSMGGAEEGLESFSKVVRVLAAPALALLAARLTAVGSAAAFGAGGLTAFAAANPFTAAIVAGGALLSIINEIGDSAEKSSIRVRASSEALANDLARQSAERRESVVASIEQAADALQSNTRGFVVPLTAGLGELNREFARLNKDSKAFDKQIKDTSQATLRAATQVIKDTDRAIRNLSKTANNARDDIRKAQESSDEGIFNVQLDAADPVRQFRLINQRIEALSKERQDAVRSGDRDAFNRAQKDLTKLSIQRSGLRNVISGQTNAEAAVNREIETRKQLLEDELKQRQALVSQIEAQESAARQVRAEQEILRNELSSALETFRSGALTDALGGSDTDQIRRTLAERQEAAERLASLQERLGITQVSNGDLALAQQRDLENATNRIAAIQTQAAIKERQDIDRVIKARLEAVAEEQKLRDEANNQEIAKLDKLRQALGETIQLSGFSQSNITGGTDVTALSTALAGANNQVSSADNLSKGLQPTVQKLGELIAILQRPVDRITPADRARATQLRRQIQLGIQDVAVALRGQQEAPTREGLERFLRDRLGQSETGREALIGQTDRVTQEEINQDVEAVLAVFDSLKNSTELLEGGIEDVFTSQRALAREQAELTATTKAVTDAERARILQIKEERSEAQSTPVKIPTIEELLQRRAQLNEGGVKLDPQSTTQATKSAVSASAPQLTQNYKAAVLAAAPEVRKVQVDAALAAQAAVSTPVATTGLGTAADQRAVLADQRAKELQDKLAAEARQREADAAKAKEFRRREEENARKPETGLLPGEASARRALAVARGEALPSGISLLEPTGTRFDSSKFETSLPEAAAQLDIFNLALEEVTAGLIAESLEGTRSRATDVSFGADGRVTSVGLDQPGQTARSFEVDLDAAGNAVRELAQETVKARQDLAALRLERNNTPQQAFGGAPGTIPIRGFGNGGIVPGTGTRDTVPAMLTPGERVLTREENRAFTPDLIRAGTPRARQPQSASNNIDFGGFTVNESSGGQQTAKEIQRIINRGIRQGSIKVR